jgi:hypothetical protein
MGNAQWNLNPNVLRNLVSIVLDFAGVPLRERDPICSVIPAAPAISSSLLEIEDGRRLGNDFYDRDRG